MNGPRFLNLSIGEIVTSRDPAVISTVLGSCVSVCLYSPETRCGGMLHFALPHRLQGSMNENPFHYGENAVPELIQRVGKMSAGGISRLAAKVVGGAGDIGAANADLAFRVLREHGISVVGQDVGGQHGRKALFYTQTGRLQIANLDMVTPTAMPGLRKPKVLIVDDSPTIRKILTTVLAQSGEFELVGAVANPIEAEKVIAVNRPDVITLDVHMPEMDGVTFLEKLLPRMPIPTVMITALSLEEGGKVLRALELGAVDYIQKPTLEELKEITPIICEKVKNAARARVRQSASPARSAFARYTGTFAAETVLAIGSSTGGTEALKDVFMRMPEQIPPTVVVQHIPPVFSKAFAGRLNELCPFEVKEAEDGDLLTKNRVLIAPGGRQMEIHPSPAGLKVRLTDGPAVNRHKPSVDVLLDSVAKHVGRNAIGVILTGMGDDGARGLLRLRQTGARTLAQDESTCVVYGMPRAAVEAGAVEKVVALEAIADTLTHWMRSRPAA